MTEQECEAFKLGDLLKINTQIYWMKKRDWDANAGDVAIFIKELSSNEHWTITTCFVVELLDEDAVFFSAFINGSEEIVRVFPRHLEIVK
jgi:hypothetical protein